MIDINEALIICYKQGIKVYPELIEGKQFLVIDNNGKITIDKQPTMNKHLAKAHVEKYIWVAKEILKRL